MKRIELTQDKYALVDDEDYPYLSQYKWHFFKSNFKNGNGYAMRYAGGGRKNRQTEFMHHTLMGRVTGLEIDHKDGDGLNNQKSNLRHLTHSQNLLNKDRYSNNKSGFKGVSLHSKNSTLAKPWVARIKVGDKYLSLGYFKTPEEAAKAYDKASIKHHGEFANLNGVAI